MKTSAEYLDSLLAMKPNIYMDGEQIKRDEPRLRPGINAMSLTFDMSRDPQHEGVLTAVSHITGEKINRFCHIHQNSEDLLNKQKMNRIYCRKSGGCIQRCMGIDALNALSVATHEIDQARNTDYYKRFIEYLKYFQKNDLTAACAQTDTKGNRKLRPHEQADPDLYLRIVERKRNGIIVRGAKISITMAAYANEIIAVPTRTLTAEEADWAVAFAIPADTEGVYMINRAAAPRPRQKLKAPIADFGGSEAVIVFDNVFIPWERVFMCGEWEFGGRLALLFANYHRHSYTGCKPAASDILMGLTALVAEYNGVERADHIRQKLADMIGVAELIYAAGIAAAVTAQKASSGTFIPDFVYSNVGRRHAGENIYHEFFLLCEVAGGLPATLPMESDFYAPKTAQFLQKYMMRNAKISPENQHRCFRLIGDYLVSAFSGWMQLAGVHGGGSPIMESIGLLNSYDLESRKNIAKYLAGIKE